VQFVVVSDSNASDFASRVTMPLFRDLSPSRSAWTAFDAAAVKHDTIVFDAQGQRVLYRRSSSGLSNWRTDIAATVRTLPP
jgi:hypothetical protein